MTLHTRSAWMAVFSLASAVALLLSAWVGIYPAFAGVALGIMSALIALRKKHDTDRSAA